ncbi:terminase large subunit [Bradyrhizobium sp. S3.9.1]|uniref:terminase large subunit domain-containing protein n=1 Tax=Bradyrhizobium sp. S3.9.1 TaxID=3156431 RepID=UPI0033981A42
MSEDEFVLQAGVARDDGSGPRPHFALVDELHEHPDGGVLEILERGFKFRRQPMLVMITNSGSERNSVCYTEHEARHPRRGWKPRSKRR